MKIIVDPNFPDPQPFVDIIHQVADRFLDRLHHKATLAGKLAMLEVRLNLKEPTIEDIIVYEGRQAKYREMKDKIPPFLYEQWIQETVYNSMYMNGTQQVFFEEGTVFDRIHLYAFPGACLKDFANLVAHEMTHMLLSCSDNMSCAGIPRECGSRRISSSICWQDPETHTDYGIEMEEVIARTVAHWIAKDMPLPCEEKDDDRYMPNPPLDKICDQMAGVFGPPLDSLRRLDEFSLTDDQQTIANIFWYAVAVNQFNWIISCFNETMGDGAYEKLCRYLDAKTPEAEALATEMVNRFVEESQETADEPDEKPAGQ